MGMTFSFLNTSKKDRKRGESTSRSETSGEPSDPPVDLTRDDIVRRLKRVIDPEIGVNIVDLGLIYGLHIDGSEAVVRLTMTTPACPMSSYIKQEVQRALRRLPGLRDGRVELVWDPPWTPMMMDPEMSKQRLGIRYRAV